MLLLSIRMGGIRNLDASIPLWGTVRSPIEMAADEHTTHAPASAPATTRGYSASKEQLLARLRRIEGQVRGIERMVEDDRYCIDVLTQISAAQAALEKVALGLLDGHARECVLPAGGQLQADRTDELMAAVGRLVKRG
jgi:DNA-binding FrmR family transcriptional regulator